MGDDFEYDEFNSCEPLDDLVAWEEEQVFQDLQHEGNEDCGMEEVLFGDC